MASPQKIAFFVLLLCFHNAESFLTPDYSIINGPCIDLQNPIADLVLKIIHDVQTRMPDPMNISKYNFDIRESGLKVYGNVRNVSVKNLSKFNVTNITTHVFKRSVTVTLDIPNLIIVGLYTLKGKALSFVPINGKGPFIMKPEKTTATVYAELGYKEGHFVLDDFNYKLSIGELYVKFEGVYGNKIASDVLNAILNKFGIALFNKMEPLVHEEIRQELVTEIDQILRNATVFDFTNTMKTLALKSLCQ